MTSVSEDRPEPETEELPHHPPKKAWGCGQWFVVTALIVLGSGFTEVLFLFVGSKKHQMQATNNARQIIISLKAYAGDHEGKYPEGATANDAFRELIKGGQLEDERVFGCLESPFTQDGIIGTAPDFAQALQTGENHWAMTKGLTDASSGNCPLVFENPALASWPPRWDGRLVGVAKPGRVWKSDRVIVGRNDGSVGWEQLTRGNNPLITLQPIKDGKNLFELAGPHEILDVAR